MAEQLRISDSQWSRTTDSRVPMLRDAYGAGNSQVTLNDQLYNLSRHGSRGVYTYYLDPVQKEAPAPAPAAPEPESDPIADALNQLSEIFKPPPPPPSPPAPVRQSVGPQTATVERRKVDFGGFAAAATAPTGGDFTRRRRARLGAGI